MTPPLPPQDPGAPDEQLPGEAELGALYRQLPQSEPGPALDAAVLRAATQALSPDEKSSAVLHERRKAERERGDWVHPKAGPSTPPASPVAAGPRKKSRWLIALSSAATLVLAAGLTWYMGGLPPPESAPAAKSVAPTGTTAAAPAPHAAPPTPPELPKQRPPRVVVAQLQASAAAPHTADTPAQELDKIQQLFAQHQDNEARQRLEAFHQLHPTWDLPPELRAQLRQP
jgi:hypothetical protein